MSGTGGGARGGAAEFSWDAVKAGDNADRSFYLGNSVKAAVGRWQAGRDLSWYAKRRDDAAAAAAADDELAAVKAREAEAMAAALGVAPEEVGGPAAADDTRHTSHRRRSRSRSRSPRRRRRDRDDDRKKEKKKHRRRRSRSRSKERRRRHRSRSRSRDRAKK